MPDSTEGFEHLHGISRTPATQPFPDGLLEAEPQRDRAEVERCRVELLLRDVSHRIGNILAMVSSMLSIQVAGTAKEDVRSMLRTAQRRVGSMV